MVRMIVSPPPPFRPLSHDAYGELREAILAGRLPPGVRIVEAEIARQMAISRGPIREAIRRLESDGLVEYQPRRGTVVVRLSPDEVRDAYYLRAHLEAYAVRLAAVRATETDFATLEELIDRMCASAGRDEFGELLSADVAFHAHICQLSGSKRLYRLWDSLNPHSWTLLTGLKASGYTLEQIAVRHRPILAALQAGDADQAEREIRLHIIELGNNVLEHLVGDPERPA